jgi:hypothetical protein
MCYNGAQHRNQSAEHHEHPARQHREGVENCEHRVNRNFKVLFVALVSIFVWFVQPAVADVTGTILGVVTDPSAAVVPGAKVVLRNANIGLVRETVTDGNGSYEFLAVPVGENYSVEVEAEGFRKSAQSTIQLLVNQRFRADFKLEVGSVKEALTVAANVVQVESVTTQLGDVIEDKKMEDLPLNGRSYLDLLGLQLGVVPINTTGVGEPISGLFYGGRLSVNGLREDANAFLVNGANVEETNFNGTLILPTLDSIQEFRLITNSFDAEYGQFAGAVVNAITKSGTNAFHGTAFEFLRNTDLDARNFFDVTKGLFRQNQFGGVLGGPILKNRLFFFVDYQGTRQAVGTQTGTIPTPSLAERGGDFSDVATTGYASFTGLVRGDNVPADGAMPTVLSQRLGYPVTSGEPYWTPNCTSMQAALAGVCVFPNQVIPQSAWSPAGAGLLKFIPMPTGTSGGGQPFYRGNLLQTTSDDKFAPRIDLVNRLTGNWSFYYSYDNAALVSPFQDGDVNIPGFSSSDKSRSQEVTVSNTYIFGPRTVNEVNLSFVRLGYEIKAPIGGLGKLSSFGFDEGGLGIIPQLPSAEGVPNVKLNQLGMHFLVANPEHYWQDQYRLTDGLSTIKGKHTLKFGGDFAAFQNVEHAGGNFNGTFTFNGEETGNDFADFLIGAPDEFNQHDPYLGDLRLRTASVYAQDSYRLRSNLTINYGLRWELGEPWYDIRGQLQAFIPGMQSQVYLNSPTGFVFPGDPGVTEGDAPTHYRDFSPRLGIAYSPAAATGLANKIFGGPGKTSIRAAAGLFYTTFDAEGSHDQEGDAPFANFFVSPTLVYFEEPYKSRLGANNPGQRFPIPALSPNVSFASFQPLSGNPGLEVHDVTPRVVDFNFTIQRRITNSTIMTVGYVGTLGRHLYADTEFNPGNQAKCLQIAKLFNLAGEPGLGCGTSGEDTIYNINGQTFDGTRPYSVTSGRYLSQGILDFADETWVASMATSSYNGLQITLNKTIGPQRFLAAYTYSKSLDNGSTYRDLPDPYNYRLSKSISAFDMTNNFVLSYTLDLPFQHLARARAGIAYKILAGWEVAGITRFTTGVPVWLSESGDRSLCGCEGDGNSSVDLPDYNGQPLKFFNPRTSSNMQYFSTDDFSAQQLGQIGTADRRFFHGPGLNNWDVSFFKNTHLTEQISMDIRAEFFNTFNHAQFNNPVSDFAASNFGQITTARDPRIVQVAMKIHF